MHREILFGLLRDAAISSFLVAMFFAAFWLPEDPALLTLLYVSVLVPPLFVLILLLLIVGRKLLSLPPYRTIIQQELLGVVDAAFLQYPS